MVKPNIINKKVVQLKLLEFTDRDKGKARREGGRKEKRRGEKEAGQNDFVMG